MTSSPEKVLLIVDVQGSFFFGSMILPDKEAFLSNVVSLVDKARAANPPVKIIWVRHEESPGPEAEMIPHTPLWEIMSPLSPIPSESIVEKKGPNAFKNTTLPSLLPKDPKEFQLFIAGLQCINWTARGAVDMYGKDLSVSVVSGAHATFGSEDGSKSGKEVTAGIEEGLKEVGVAIVKVDSVPF